jgi:hypothetical protein
LTPSQYQYTSTSSNIQLQVFVQLSTSIHQIHTYRQRPQNFTVHLNFRENSRNGSSLQLDVYVGWTGMASTSSLACFNSDAEKGFEMMEMDPYYAMGLGLAQGDVVR